MKRAVAGICGWMLVVAPLGAEQTEPWGALGRLGSGTQVAVRTTAGTVVEGGVKAVTEGRIVVTPKAGGEIGIASADVAAVMVRQRDSLWNGVLAGAASGLAGGAGLGAAWFYGSDRFGAKPPGYGREFISGVGVLGSVVGAVIGWRIDRARTRNDVIYQAPAGARTRP